MRRSKAGRPFVVDASSATRDAVRSLVIAGGIVAALVIVDAFHAASLFGNARAIVLWSGLVGINVAAWMVWRTLAGTNATRGARLLAGSLIMNGLLAIEVPACYRALGRAEAGIDQRPFWYGILVTLVVAAAKRLARPAAGEREPIAREANAAPIDFDPHPVASSPRSVMLARAGIVDVGDLLAVRAEDHYCRLLLRGGRSTLVHYRFRDAVAELPEDLGTQVHRGTWVADRAVHRGWREGRRWSLELADGTVVPVSETSVALCRARGWLTNSASSG